MESPDPKQSADGEEVKDESGESAEAKPDEAKPDEAEETKEEAKAEPDEPKEATEETKEGEPSTDDKKATDTTKFIFLLKACDAEACRSIYINGDELPEEGYSLNHNDRIIIGNSILIFKHQAEW